MASDEVELVDDDVELVGNDVELVGDYVELVGDDVELVGDEVAMVCRDGELDSNMAGDYAGLIPERASASPAPQRGERGSCRFWGCG
jgi:hypothetical protein